MKNAHSRTSMQGSSRDRLQCGGLLLELCIEPCADSTEDLRHRVEQWPVGARKPIRYGTLQLSAEGSACGSPTCGAQEPSTGHFSHGEVAFSLSERRSMPVNATNMEKRCPTS